MYNVHVKVYSVARARAHLADLLDAAESGEHVIIERRGVRHALTVQEPRTPWRPGRRCIAIVDAGIEDGNWSWTWDARGIKPTRRRRTER